jgi:hypothetical protein
LSWKSANLKTRKSVKNVIFGNFWKMAFWIHISALENFLQKITFLRFLKIFQNRKKWFSHVKKSCSENVKMTIYMIFMFVPNYYVFFVAVRMPKSWLWDGPDKSWNDKIVSRSCFSYVWDYKWHVFVKM